MPEGRERSLSVEHPTGEFTVTLTVGGTSDAPVIERAGLLRTARLLMEGTAYVPAAVLAAPMPLAAE
jgi:4-oxalomesaconate tautomerase